MSKNILQADTGQLERSFNYKKGTVELNFRLRVDIKTQLKDFKELLEKAIKDVEEELLKKK